MSTHFLRLSSEEQLLLVCASATVDRVSKERIEKLLETELDWTRFIALARRNSVLPLVWHHLSNTRADLVPPSIRTSLSDYYRKNAARNMLLAGELIKVLDALAAEGIEGMPYKGPALAVEIYGNLALRQFGDLDILVKEKDVERASNILTALGFRPHFDLTTRQLGRFLRLSYVQLFVRDSGRLVIELHWAIAPRFFGFEWNIDDFWPRLQSTQLLGRKVLCPSPEDHLLVLCVHGIKDCWERLEWIAAVAQLLRDNDRLDWDTLIERAKSTRSFGALSIGVYLAHILFETELPRELSTAGGSFESAKRVAGEIVTRIFDLEGRVSTTERIKLHLRAKDAHTDRLRYAFRLATTTTPVDWAMLPLPSSLGFAYYVLRPFRLVAKYASSDARKPGSVN